MQILAIETSGNVGGACLWQDGRTVAQRRFTAAREHARQLVPTVEALFREAGWAPRGSLDAVAVSAGPGSYTGLRIGAACAKTVAQMTNCALVPVPSLDVIAQNTVAAARDARVKVVAAAIDAKRHEVYAALYDVGKSIASRCGEVELLAPEAFAGRIDGTCVVVGNALRQYAEAFAAERFIAAEPAQWEGSPEVVARLGAALLCEGGAVDPLVFAPVYMRLPEAEERRLEAMEGEGR